MSTRPDWFLGESKPKRPVSGRVVAAVDFRARDTLYGVVPIRAGRSFLDADHEIVRSWPSKFVPAPIPPHPSRLRERVTRGAPVALAARAIAPDEPGILSGYFGRFGSWAEIGGWEGHFMEQVAPGAFRRTLREGGQRVLLGHGRDPMLGDKPLGPVLNVREDGRGAFYEVRLLPGVPELVTEGLRAGLYGASFRFRVLREEFVERPGTSATNPKGLPERTLLEVEVSEFGPTPFPAYADATAVVA